MRWRFGPSFAREGALANPAPRSARGWGAAVKLRPRRRPLQDRARTYGGRLRGHEPRSRSVPPRKARGWIV